MNTLSLAWRNLLRNRRRSLTTLLAMIIGSVAILLFGGYSGNINLGLQTGFVRNGGHLQIQHQDYLLYGTGNPAAYGIRDYQAVIQAIKHDPELAAMLTVVTPRLNLGGIAGNFKAGVSRTVIGTGVVVDEQNQMGLWNDYAFPSEAKPSALTHTAPNAASIGVGVARVLQLCESLKLNNCPAMKTAKSVSNDAATTPSDINALSELESGNRQTQTGAAIELLAANAHGAPNVAALNVVKAEPLGVKELDDISVTLHLKQAQDLIFGQEKPQVTAIVLQLKHTAQIAAAKARLHTLLSSQFKDLPLAVYDYEAINPSYGQITGMFAAIFGFISLLIGAIVLFTVGNTMNMAVLERTVEIGTLRAMGLRRAGIRRLFVCEGVFLGLVGAVLGLLLALALAYLINHSGLSWMPPGNTDPVPLTVRVWGELKMILGTVVGLVVVASLSAWWPARHAAQLNIVEALRHT